MNPPVSIAIRYGDWSKDRQGWFLGLSGGAAVTVLLAGLPMLLAAGTHRWSLAAGWLPVWAVISTGVCVPVRGRPALRWILDAALWTLGRGMGWADWQSAAATGCVEDLAAADLPGVLAGIWTHDGPPFGVLLGRPAIVQDTSAQTWAAVAKISHPGIGLAELGARARMAAGLGELLEGAASAELVSVVAVQIRTVPDDGAERAGWQRRHLRGDAPPLALAVNVELGTAILQAGVRHEAFLTVVVTEQRISRHAKEAGGGVDGRARVLYGVMNELEAHLTGPVGCSGVTWLDSPALAAAIRTGFAPGDRSGLVEATLAAHDDPRVAARLPMAAAGPTVAPAAERRHYDHDAWSTATCTVLLPEQGALMGALAPVFTPTVAGERRSVTVFYAPISRHAADRLVGRDQMSAGTAAELRARMGFATRAVHRRDAQRLDAADTRLAAGKALVRVGIAAAVTVPSHWPITEHGRRLEASIRGAGFTPLRLDLAQDSGFAAACIPLGIGLPRRRGAR
jgi:uncharacterized small protein (DUF1192 family)